LSFLVPPFNISFSLDGAFMMGMKLLTVVVVAALVAAGKEEEEEDVAKSVVAKEDKRANIRLPLLVVSSTDDNTGDDNIDPVA
jgi:predicted alpha/beta hydrolase family esterase